VRHFRSGDEEVVIHLLKEAFGSLEHPPRVRSDLARTDPTRQNFFVIEKAGSAVGCIAVVPLARKNWYDLRYLAVRDAFSNPEISDQLVQKAVADVEMRGCEYLKATTPAVQPYVSAYEKFHFAPVRRTLRLAWDLTSWFERREHPAEVRELSENDGLRVGEMIVEGHLPYWDWWFEEHGGADVSDWPGKFGFPIGTWLGTIRKDKLVSLAGFLADAYSPGEARLECFCVLPRFRGMGIGSSLLSETLDRARRIGQKKLVIYTFAYLDSLPPGAVTYLKSGAKIEGEYLQLQKT
jgi:N-acetylglutamate synthase-like GNAT family acetyltransferase